MTISCLILMRHFKFFFCYLKSFSLLSLPHLPQQKLTKVFTCSHYDIFTFEWFTIHVLTLVDWKVFSSIFQSLSQFEIQQQISTLPVRFSNTPLFVRVLLKFKRYLMDVSHCKALMSINHASIESLITTSIQAFIVTGKWLISFDMSGARYLCKRDMLNGRWNDHRSPLFHHSCKVCHSLFV